MKKFVKLFILICVCFIPVLVDAKVNFEFKDDYTNKFFLDEKNGEYFYIDTNKDLYEANNVVVYSRNGNFLRRDSFIEEEVDSSSDPLTSSKFFDSFNKLYIGNGNSVYDEENDILYNVYYYSERFSYYDSEGNYIRKGFNDDLEFTKKLLGKKYDAYLMFKESGAEVNKVVENNGYYLVYYYDSEYKRYVSVLDKNLKSIKMIENDTYCAYVYDDLIYVMKNSTTLDTYKLDGSLLQTLNISYELLDDADGDSCGSLVPYSLYVKNNELFIMYNLEYCEERIETNDFFMEKANIGYGSSVNSLTLVYSLSYDVEKVEPSNGDFTYTRKFDDGGREYVELKISPLKGYSVEDIIVTDINGRRIEVTNNKFYMPTSDVRVEVKFAEYVPIPDTFSSISPLIKIIAVFLIAFGIGIMCFSFKSKKAK